MNDRSKSNVSEMKKKEEGLMQREVVNDETVTQIELRKAFDQSTQHGNSEFADITYVFTLPIFKYGTSITRFTPFLSQRR